MVEIIKVLGGGKGYIYDKDDTGVRDVTGGEGVNGGTDDTYDKGVRVVKDGSGVRDVKGDKDVKDVDGDEDGTGVNGSRFGKDAESVSDGGGDTEVVRGVKDAIGGGGVTDETNDGDGRCVKYDKGVGDVEDGKGGRGVKDVKDDMGC